MKITAKQINSLEKIYRTDLGDYKEQTYYNALKGESFSYQLILNSDEHCKAKITVDSALSPYISLYETKDVIMDVAAYNDCAPFEKYMTKSPGTMPDLLQPVTNNYVNIKSGITSLWVEVSIPCGCTPTDYTITITADCFRFAGNEFAAGISSTFNVRVLEAELPKQSTIFTEWFYADCIASIHDVPIYSEEHWQLIDRYMQTAAKIGVNMILTPVITPPLDVEIGSSRPDVQLVKIEKIKDSYAFDFSLLHRWIELCKNNGIEYFEISHLFSQWGCEFAPNIFIWKNGEKKHMFGWHIKAASKEYADFLAQFLPSLTNFLREEGIDRKCRFHISDEPNESHLESYSYAYNLVKPYLKDFIIMDALSDIEFYSNGLVENPVCATDHIEPFLEAKVPNLWVYYCCGQGKKVSNRFLSMPSSRNRIIGLQLYKFDIKSFLHWGYNFYYSGLSRYLINPYITTSSDGHFPSGDAFSVYPGKDGPLLSLRALVFRDALEDIEICRLLENKIGRENVIKMIDSAAGMNVTFSEYPTDSSYIPNLIDNMKKLLQN